MKIMLDKELHLTPLHPDHSKSLFEILTAHRSHFSPWLPFVNELKYIEQTQKFILESQALVVAKKDFSFAIIVKNQAKGIISAKELNWVSKSTELGYWLDPEIQNQGIMKKSLIRMVEWLSETFGFQTFWIKCAQGNISSQRVAIKAGFELVDQEKRTNEKVEQVYLIFRLQKS
ncbi:GNAT family N-acetyltransferase [Lunatimonas salinarum]|uniref:GNAT family N-acetyltransferase n=1 Tax=Lunatimonas salinarum TaxID=1774590 RepID=UPI001ADEF77D|nr:GNAT family N-acetyltransferase [Lunatimonas salinarum]